MKILILQLKRIGDLILTTPVVRSLRDAFPEAHITLLVDAPGAQILDGIPVDEKLVFDRQSSLLLGAFGIGGNAWLRDLRASGYDVCLDFTGTDRSALIALFSGAKRRISYQRFAKKFFQRMTYNELVDVSVRNLHTADYHTQLLLPLECATESVALDLAPPPEPPAILAQASITSPYVVIHPGTARSEKYWQPERWAEVARHLAATGLTVVFTGSTDDDEQAHLRAIRTGLDVKTVDLTGRTNLLELAAVIRDARLFCGVDTAAMHLADAMRTPTVALFGPTNPFHWRPRHTRNITLRAFTEEPFTPAQKGGAMSEIATATVTDSIDLLLAADRAG